MLSVAFVQLLAVVEAPPDLTVGRLLQGRNDL